MVKRLLSAFIFVTSSIIATAQCTPDVSCVPSGKTFGFCPDTTVGIKHGVVNVPYSETVSVKIPKDASDFGFPLPITSIQITDVTGLAPGLTYTCSEKDCIFPGNSTGCILISGTPTQAWNKTIVLKVKVVSSITIDREVPGYRCVVTDPNGIETWNASVFEVSQNAPNPFNGKSEIKFNSPSYSTIDFKVYNMLGAIVYSNSFKADKGQNSIIVDASSFTPGVYMYSIANAVHVITKRMIVSK